MADRNTDNTTLLTAVIDELRITNARLDRLARVVSELATEKTLKVMSEEVAATNRERASRLHPEILE